MTKPTHFLAYRINSRHIKNTITELQTHIQTQFPRLKACCIDVPTLHVTLVLLDLKSDQEITLAIGCLQSFQHLFSRKYQPMTLDFKGIQTFPNSLNVFFTRPETSRALTDLVNLVGELTEHFQAQELVHRASSRPHTFQPHLTILKTSRALALVKRLNRKNHQSNLPSIQSQLNEYLIQSSSINLEFGSDTFDTIELVSMVKDLSTGYYEVLSRISLK